MYEASHIHLRAGGRSLLSEARVRVMPGRVTALIGANGAGKSTLLKVLSGEVRPQAGEVHLDGKELRTLRPALLAKLRAVVPQSAQLAFPFTVAEVVAIGASDGRAQPSLICEALAQVDLTGFEGRPYERLSGGERQRVQIARALAQLASGVSERVSAPGYLLLDEPTASLDLAQQLLVLRRLRHLAETGGIGILAVLHDLNLAAMVADSIVAMKDGRVIAEGPPQEVITDDRITALYGVSVRIGWAPTTPFLLPQSAQN